MNLRRDVFQAVADPTRRAILLLVASQSMTAGAIAANFDTARPTVSKHLQILTACELLNQAQTGREIYYHLNPNKMKELADFIEPFRRLWEDRFNHLEALMKTTNPPDMEQKTKLLAENGKQDFVITRAFDLPVELLFRAYAEPDLVAQWMGTNVLQLESKPHGSWRFETTNAQGKVVFRANGVIHEFTPNRKITRTFEMENAPFGVQLEFLEFEPLTDNTSQLRMHVVYRTAAARDQMLHQGIGMAKGLDLAHNRLQEILNHLK